MLTEQDIAEMIVMAGKPVNISGTVMHHSDYQESAKLIHSQHLAECERLMEIAFNAASEIINDGQKDGFVFPQIRPKYPTFQDFKDSLKS